MKYFSKGLELVGLLIVGQSLLVGLMAEYNAMFKELKLLLLGSVVFVIGYFIESYWGPSE